MILSKNQNGFTLVELAVSLMIIGILIGAVLKGVELIENARSAQWVRQLKEYEVAVKAFILSYDALPGDLDSATTRLPNCSSPCVNGVQDKQIGSYAHPPNVVNPVSFYGSGENRNFWIHLGKAGLITGIDIEYSGVFTGEPGIEVPKGPSNNSMIGVGYYWGGANNSWVLWGYQQGFKSGNYYVVFAPSTTTSALSPRTAYYIDEKLDDGQAYTGLIRPLSRPSLGAAFVSDNCASATNNQYDLTKSDYICNLMIYTR